MQVVDTLRIGGAERVGVNLANLLPQNRYRSFLCSTRQEGALVKLVQPHVKRLSLHRRSTLDPAAVVEMVQFIRENNIQILHAHASALFFARMVSLLPPFPKVIWHDHYGRYLDNDRSVPLYKTATHKIGGVVAVNRPLEEWSRDTLGVPADRVRYIPNLVEATNASELEAPLPGAKGRRIVCVANFRPQKDHQNLLSAMKIVAVKVPDAHLLLVGSHSDEAYRDSVVSEIAKQGLSQRVSYLGARHDVATILAASDIGVLASRSEGLPLALLEYGMAGLATVATSVGQCPEVLDNGTVGILVEPTSPEPLAESLVQLLQSPAARAGYGAKFKRRVEARYSAKAIISQICEMYSKVLGETVSGKSEVAEAQAVGSAK